MKKNNVKTLVRKQNRMFAAKARRKRRQARMAEAIQDRLPGLYKLIDSLQKRVKELTEPKTETPTTEVAQ